MNSTFLGIIANADPIVNPISVVPGEPMAAVLSVLIPLLVGLVASAVLFYFFAKACFKVTSFKKLLSDLRTGKEENRCLRILFVGSSGIFKSYYEFQLKTMGDRGMVFLIRILGVICAIACAASLLALGSIGLIAAM